MHMALHDQCRTLLVNADDTEGANPCEIKDRACDHLKGQRACQHARQLSGVGGCGLTLAPPAPRDLYRAHLDAWWQQHRPPAHIARMSLWMLTDALGCSPKWHNMGRKLTDTTDMSRQAMSSA